jgi:hypothetical protein
LFSLRKVWPLRLWKSELMQSLTMTGLDSEEQQLVFAYFEVEG